MTETAPPALGEEPSLRPSPAGGHVPLRLVARIAVPLLILAGALHLYLMAASYWSRFQGLSLGFAFAVYLAVMARGRARDAAAIAASILFALLAGEAYFVLHYRTSIDSNTPGYSVYNDVLGWGPAHPGVYHHHKTDAKTGQVIIDVDYTIDQYLTRKVESAADGPTIAIGGGSDVFGIGVPDSGTLPQAVADATGRRLHVVNLAFSGYGPQQFLRILETGIDDKTLTRPRAFVFASLPELAERAACNRGFTLPGPRYEVVDGKATFRGTCGERWSLPLRWLFAATSMFDIIAAPLDDQTVRQKLDLFIAILIRAGQVAREKYGAPTLIFYVSHSGYPEAGDYTDDQVIDQLRAGGLTVVDGGLDPHDFPGQDLAIPKDGHPTVVAHRARAALLVKGLAGIVSLDP